MRKKIRNELFIVEGAKDDFEVTIFIFLGFMDEGPFQNTLHILHLEYFNAFLTHSFAIFQLLYSLLVKKNRILLLTPQIIAFQLNKVQEMHHNLFYFRRTSKVKSIIMIL